ncbi:2-succinyl-5-enolpyruvyl-6-hydroxy-3-cyclohexene-1-carboxylic-acid synthase [Vibrio clamense]|uniref:2-succinyl-5-enolpyruvyl-6-hydroxy-3- cyclohexene-1-carboxylic-acid synthase n=1 Tax=Vibrio TaxID=662 RepID=UPI00352CE321
MSTDQAVLNRIWSETLLEELVRLGVEEVCVAPGSRSTPLTLEADANMHLNLHTHFDERGLGFLALGLAKASNKPVAIIVTSGTAVANLLPAIAESKLTGEKLVVLTADRPVELVNCGANQAIDQVGIFSSHVVAAQHLPSPSTSVPLAWLLTTTDKLLHQQRLAGGSVHINCPFPEPLYSSGSKEAFSDYLAPLSRWKSSSEPYTHTFQTYSAAVSDVQPADWIDKKGVIIVGSLPLQESQKVADFAQSIGWPLLCDPQSGISSAWRHYDLWMQKVETKETLAQCDVIIQFGERIVSKRLNHWIEQTAPQMSGHYLVISPDAHRINQSHLPQRHVVSSASQFIEYCSLPLIGMTNSGWADGLICSSEKITHLAQAQVSSGEDLTELVVAVDVATQAEQHDVFLGNSLIVRLVDMLGELPNNEVFTNRGASGIDGLVATASGVQRARQRSMLMLIGDTALLYDLNSLALLNHCPQAMVVVVTNNDGGAIFDLLPVPKQKKQSLYQMPHGYQFEHAAKQFNLAYCQPQTLSAYRQAIAEHFESGTGVLLVEVITPAEQASNQLNQLMQQINAS